MATRTCASMSCETAASTNLKRCAGCRQVWYCSQRCQTDHWMFHIFDCNPRKPISTVYYLARACREDVRPLDPQTRTDYGFHVVSWVLGGEAQDDLCGLYQGLLNHLHVHPKDLREWQREGRLVEGIKSAYETLPPGTRGAYYSWFLEHQHLFDGSPLDDKRVVDDNVARINKMHRDGWIFTGGSPNDDEYAIWVKIAAFSPARRECHSIYAGLVANVGIGPQSTTWLPFGFVAAPSQGGEADYSRMYRLLIHLCTFDEFCVAYESSSIPALFDHYGLSMSVPHLFRDVMSGSPTTFKSVWHLKQYIALLISSMPDDHPTPVPSVVVDYGFENCKDASDWKMLDDLYTKLLTRCPRADPLELHDACVKGQLVEYAKRFVKLAPWTAKYTRLLKNRYTLRMRVIC